MYGLPTNMDLSFLLGKELIQVCIGTFQSILRCGGGACSSLECEYRVFRMSGDGDGTSAPCSSADGLTAILGRKIVGVTNNGGGELAITFSNDSVLVIYDTNTEYESYQISDRTCTIVV